MCKDTPADNIRVETPNSSRVEIPNRPEHLTPECRERMGAGEDSWSQERCPPSWWDGRHLGWTGLFQS